MWPFKRKRDPARCKHNYEMNFLSSSRKKYRDHEKDWSLPYNRYDYHDETEAGWCTKCGKPMAKFNGEFITDEDRVLEIHEDRVKSIQAYDWLQGASDDELGDNGITRYSVTDN